MKRPTFNNVKPTSANQVNLHVLTTIQLIKDFAFCDLPFDQRENGFVLRTFKKCKIYKYFE